MNFAFEVLFKLPLSLLLWSVAVCNQKIFKVLLSVAMYKYLLKNKLEGLKKTR